jgi:hypothetical protein
MGGFFVIWRWWEDRGGNSHEEVSVEWYTQQQDPPHEADNAVLAGPFETSAEGRFWIRCYEEGMTDEEIVAAMNDWKPDLPHGAVRSDE